MHTSFEHDGFRKDWLPIPPAAATAFQHGRGAVRAARRGVVADSRPAFGRSPPRQSCPLSRDRCHSPSARPEHPARRDRPQDDGRMRLLGRLRERADGGEVIVPPVVLGHVRGPERLHRHNGFLGLRPAMRDVAPHDLRLLLWNRLTPSIKLKGQKGAVMTALRARPWSPAGRRCQTPP
jgi:hypothetical protein